MPSLHAFHHLFARFSRWFEGMAVASNVESGGKPAGVNAIGVLAVMGEITRPEDEPRETSTTHD